MDARSLVSVSSRILLTYAGELVAPTRCAACDARVRPRTLFCAACAATVVGAPAIDASRPSAVFAYGGAIATAIAKLKYAGRADLAPRLGAMMAQAARPLAGLVDVVVPVPLHPKRLAERGFDQAALLAAPVARALEVTLAIGALARLRDTPKQASLGRDARASNVRGAFVCRAPARVARRRVLLIDDVRTTGATFAACEAALRSAAPRAVATLTLARRDRDDDP